jgi:SAM-dependent methyltransferase
VKAIDNLIARRSFNNRFNHLKVVPGGRYLDVGCGLGTMVAAMSRLGMQAHGVEPSPIAAGQAREAGLAIFCGMLREAKYDHDSFDCVSMFHVLEHTPNPVDVLRECCRIIKPEGEIVIAVPNYDSLVFKLVGWSWIGLDQPRHLHQFRPRSIRVAAEQAGARIVDIETESLIEHVENELVRWLRSRLLIPARLMLATKAARPLATQIAKIGNKSGQGEAIVVRMERNSSIY